MLDVQCTCGTRLNLPDQWAGKKGKCPACGAVLDIPQAHVETIEDSPPPVQDAVVAVRSARRAPAPSAPLPAVSLDRPRPIAVVPPVAEAIVAPWSQRVDVRRWSLTWKLGAGAGAVVMVLLLGYSLIGGSRPASPTDDVKPPTVAAAGNSNQSEEEPPQPKPTPVKVPSQPIAAKTSVDRPPAGSQIGSSTTEPPGQPALKAQPLPQQPRTNRPGGLTGASREYDDLHCKMIQSQHSVRVPATATMLEVDGERLPLANLGQLAESRAPLLFLPKGKHAVRFRTGEQAVMVTIESDLSQVYGQMRRYFDVSGTVHDKELFQRGARAMDVHGAPFLLNLMGATHLGGEQWEAAERKFRRALRVNPLFAPAHLNLAVCLERRKARSDAIREVELAEACNVGNAVGLAAAIAEVRRKVGLPAGGRPAADVALVSYVHAESLSEEDRRLTALMQGMSKYAVRDEERAKIRNNLAVHFAETGRPELALDHFRSALGVLKNAGPERFALARQVLSHMSEACRKAGFDEATEYQAMQSLVSP